MKEYGIETVSVLPGPFPTEVGNQEKQGQGQGPDRQDVIDFPGLVAGEFVFSVFIIN